MQECPQQVGLILETCITSKKPHCKAADQLMLEMETNPLNANVHIPTGFTSDSDVGYDTNDDVDNDGLQNRVGNHTNQIKSAVNCESSQVELSTDDVIRKRKHASVSDRPMDIIYGRPNETRSG